AAADRVVEEVVVRDLLLVLSVLPGTEGEDHVVEALEGVTRDGRVLSDPFEVVGERSLPDQILISCRVVLLPNQFDDVQDRRAHEDKLLRGTELHTSPLRVWQAGAACPTALHCRWQVGNYRKL